jgi:23S rRNA (adenine2030-N6)-methyltransferase
MNYRHAFHAGNFADAVKHVTLQALLTQLSRKAKPWCYVETHAGRGAYRLDGPEARRAGEWKDGIGRLVDAAGLPAPVDDYLRSVRSLPDNASGLCVYPGSPLLAQAAMREGDRAILAELVPEEAAALKALCRGDPRIAVHRMDGYQALKALLPPEPRRGLVLVDPPYESADEIRRLPDRLAVGLRRWPTGIFALWFPIKDRRELAPLWRGLAEIAEDPVLVAELRVAPTDNAARMNGTGMAILRAPWRFEETLGTCWTALAQVLGQSPSAGSSVRWLAPAADRRRVAEP